MYFYIFYTFFPLSFSHEPQFENPCIIVLNFVFNVSFTYIPFDPYLL